MNMDKKESDEIKKYICTDCINKGIFKSRPLTAGEGFGDKCDFCGKEELIIDIVEDYEQINKYLALSKIVIPLLKDEKPTATEIMVKEILQDKYIYTTRDDEKSEMWIYKDGIYIPQARTFIREFCRYILGKAYTSYTTNQVIAKIEADTYINFEEFFNNNIIDEIPVQNGILNLHEKSLREFSPKDVFFNKIPIIFDKEKDCPNIKKFFQEIVKDEEDVPVIQEFFGYCLYKKYHIPKSFMLNGEGSNGKSKLLELLKRFVGAENCSGIPIQDFDIDGFSQGELFGKMINMAGDISSKSMNYIGEFKKLTGGDLIDGRRKFLPRIRFINYAKLIFSCNQLPNIYEDSDAVWRRWVILDFPHKFLSKKEIDILPEEKKEKVKEADIEIIEKLTYPDEMSGLLNWALEGLNRLLKQKDFSYSKSMDEVKNIWLRKSNSFRGFVVEFLEADESSNISKVELKEKYVEYCKEKKLKILGDRVIKKVLDNEFSVFDERENIGDKKISYWVGVRFKENV